MKKIGILCAAVTLLAASASAQVVLDNFDAGINAPDWTITGFGNVSAYVGGANSTAGAIQLGDNGFSYSATKTYTAAAPAAGNYKITFYYQNGHIEAPHRSLKVFVNGVEQVALSGTGAGTPVTTWTAAETGVFALTAAQNVVFSASSANETTIEVRALFDEIVLEPVTVVPVTNRVRPLTGSIVAGTTELTVVPAGGSGTYTSVAFDIGNDSTIDHTDSTSGDGFTFSWDTTSVTDGAVQVRVITTDDAALVGETTITLNVDNADGREELFFSDFESWTSGVPDGWTKVDFEPGTSAVPSTSNPSPTSVVSEETADPYAGTKSLHINYPAGPEPYRYVLLSDGFEGDRTKYQASYAYRGGSFNRLAYFISPDGSAWYSSFRLFDPGSAGAWGEKVDVSWNPGFEFDELPANIAIATHFFGAGDQYADNVRVTASQTAIEEPPPPTDAKNWDLYN